MIQQRFTEIIQCWEGRPQTNSKILNNKQTEAENKQSCI